jgi:protein TonB
VESPTTIDRIESTPAVVSTATADVARTVAANHAEEPVSAPTPAVVERGAPVENVSPIVESGQPVVARPVTSGAESVMSKEERTAAVTAPAVREKPVPAPVTQQVAALSPVGEAGAPESPQPNVAPEAVRSPIGEPRESVGRETDQVVAKSARQTPAAKADYRWLAESLYHRIAELKRYPSAARLNGWEGKVVLRAVIKADGNLADLRVQTSSGFDALDQAALDTVRQACPLHLKHELGRPEVVVSLPIVYSLSN